MQLQGWEKASRITVRNSAFSEAEAGVVVNHLVVGSARI
jgi:hypothetical protein